MPFDVFISYNTNDRPSVVKLAEKLKARGLAVWLDVWNLQPGVPFQKALEKMIKETKTVALVVGSNGIGPWQDKEMEACIHLCVKKGMTIIPVLLKDANDEPDLPLFLSGHTWVDFRNGSEIEALARLEWGITGINPQTYQKLVRPFYQHERDFLQILLTQFLLERSKNGFKLEVSFDHNTPAISKREARRFLRKNMKYFDKNVRKYRDKYNDFIVNHNGDACNFDDLDFMFRYASGGTLPIIRWKDIDYYCLFFRNIHPIGWNIANGGCNNLEELLNPVMAIQRELREELIVVDSENWYTFKEDKNIILNRPELMLAQKFWDNKFANSKRRSFQQLKKYPIEITFSPGPDFLTIKYDSGDPIEYKDIYITITAEDFGIEIDKVIVLDMGSNENLTLCDGEINDLHSVNRPIGLFRVDGFDVDSEKAFIPDLFFHDACREKEGRYFHNVVTDRVLSDMKKFSKKYNKEILNELEKVIDGKDYNLCPVTYQLIKRHQEAK